MSPESWNSDASHDPREWILEDWATFQQVFHEVDDDDEPMSLTIPRGQEQPFSRCKEPKLPRSQRKDKKKGKETRQIEEDLEDQCAGAIEFWTWMLDGKGSGKESRGGKDYFMSGALGVRSVEDCDGATAGCPSRGEIGGGSSSIVCKDGFDGLDPGGGGVVEGGQNTAGSCSGDVGAGILKSGGLKKKSKGKARVRFDVEADDVGGCSGRGREPEYCFI